MHSLQVFKDDPFTCCHLTSITNPAAILRAAVAPPKLAPGVQMTKAAKPEVKKQDFFAKSGGLKKDEPVKSASVGALKEEKPKKSPEKKSSSVNSGSKKPAGGIANFFAAQAAKPKVEKVVVKEEAKEEVKSEEKENVSNNQKVKEVKEERKPVKKEEKKPAKKTEIKSFGKRDKVETNEEKKRKRIQVMSDSEEEEEEKEEDTVEEEAPPPPPQAKLLESDSEDEVDFSFLKN